MKKINIVNFNEKHILQANKLVLNNYNEQREHVNDLPSLTNTPCLFGFARNGLGVAMEYNYELLGFIGCYKPMQNHLGCNKGTWSPAHAHAAIKENREEIYSMLYEAVCKKWLDNEILSHSITLYSHDTCAIKSFFDNGFGMRLVESIRNMNSVDCLQNHTNVEFSELEQKNYHQIFPLSNMLVKHMNCSPIYMPVKQNTIEDFVSNIESDIRYFVARKDDSIIAFIKIQDDGEHFACRDKSMISITGAYNIEKFRGSGIFTSLLSYLVDTLKAEGYTRIGVEFESFNPNARGFWLKHFKPYTYSVVRRHDERILDTNMYTEF